MSPLSEEERTCIACGMLDPPGGLELGSESGGAEYEWFCREVAACVTRVAANLKRDGRDAEEAAYRIRRKLL